MSVFEAAQKNIPEFDIFFTSYWTIFFPFYTRADCHTKYKKWVCQRLVCQKREFATRSSSCEFQDVKFTISKCQHEIFMRIDMKHSYFS